MHRAVIDHRSQEFSRLGSEVLENLRPVFQTTGPGDYLSFLGTGAWEAAIVNTLSAGDRVLMFETGHFSQLWRQLAERFGIVVDYVPGNWRRGASVAELASRLDSDHNHTYKAVMVVHNETSTGVTTSIADIRQQMNRSNHPALLMVDTISSLGSIDYRHDEWGVDVTVAGSQKGLMLPPGLSFNAISEKALAANKSAKLPRSYWDWQEMLDLQSQRLLPLHPRHHAALWLAGGSEDAARRRAAQCVSPSPASRGGHARRRCEPGVWKLSAKIRASIRARSPRCSCRKGMMRIGCGASSWKILTCLSEPASPNSPEKYFASGISAASTISCSREPSAE